MKNEHSPDTNQMLTFNVKKTWHTANSMFSGKIITNINKCKNKLFAVSNDHTHFTVRNERCQLSRELLSNANLWRLRLNRTAGMNRKLKMIWKRFERYNFQQLKITHGLRSISRFFHIEGKHFPFNTFQPVTNLMNLTP